MLSQQIDNDFKQAMKDKNPVKVSTLSLLRSQFKYALIDKQQKAREPFQQKVKELQMDLDKLQDNRALEKYGELETELKKVYAEADKAAEAVGKLEDFELHVVIKKQIKQRQDSIEQYEKGGRPELAGKEKDELDILKSYLPAEMSVDEIEKVVRAIVQETGSAGMKDMGRVMKEASACLAGRADNKAVSETVKKILSQP